LGIFPPHPVSQQSQKHACNMQTNNKKQNKWNNTSVKVRRQHRPPLFDSKRPSKPGQVKTLYTVEMPLKGLFFALRILFDCQSP